MHVGVGGVGPGGLGRDPRGEGTRVGTSDTRSRMDGEGGARVGDHAPSVFRRVADSQWYWMTIITMAKNEKN